MDPKWLPDIQPPDIISYIDEEPSLVEDLIINMRLLKNLAKKNSALARNTKFSIPSLSKGTGDLPPTDNEEMANIIDLSSDEQDEQ
ncbi:hypothetical protein MXB_3961 [Myxobolus squamalis]|nr:hypothetical protein MXB_3961 [Myxobolus squamalis]